MPIRPFSARHRLNFSVKLFWNSLPIFAAWTFVIPSLIPIRDRDRGIFVSVAERVLAGDTLYTDVLDNKEPFFYYAVSLQRWVGPLGEISFEIGTLILICFSIYQISQTLLSPHIARLVSWVAVPLIFTGRSFVPGYTHLPGSALVLLMFYASLYGRWVAAGILFAMLFFTKIIMVPVAFSMASVAFGASATRRGALAFITAAFTTLIICAIAIGWRGELWPYLDVLRQNVAYSQGKLIHSTTFFGLAIEHFRRVYKYATAITFSLTIGCALFYLARKHAKSGVIENILLYSFVASLFCSALVLAATGLWPHHAQILYMQAALALILLLYSINFVRLKPDSCRTIALVFVCGWLLGGAAFERYAYALRNTSHNIQLLSALSPETALAKRLSAPTSYARLGMNFDFGHAFGLRLWHLACPRFHQYSFDPDWLLEELYHCLPSAEILIVSSSFKRDETSPGWNRFVEKCDKLVGENYNCTYDGEIQVCKRRSVHWP